MFGTLLRRVGARIRNSREESDRKAYLRNGRRPWSRGYESYKREFLNDCFSNSELMQRFASGLALPAKFGEFLDERVVEYPWLFTRLKLNSGRLLDAGSVLNHAHLLQQPILANKKATIVTLAPESECHWRRGISYAYADLRDLPFRDDYFDEIACISTLEHVGKDNARIYTSNQADRENDLDAFLVAANELKRVCKTGGLIALTVPFGRFMDFGWYQQFDGDMLDRLIVCFEGTVVRQSFFRYADGGWQFSTRDACANCVGFDIHSAADFDPDYAAASRGIAALEIRKGGAA